MRKFMQFTYFPIYRRFIVRRFFIFSFLFCTALISKNRNPTENMKKFTVGTASGYAPYVSLTVDGQYEGFDIDISKALAKKLGMELEIKDFGSMPSLLLALQQKKVDAIIWALSITEKRRENMALIHYHGNNEEYLPFLFWKKIPDGIQTISDLKKMKDSIICVEVGTSQDEILSSFSDISIKHVDKITDAVMDVRFGKSLTAPVDPSLVAGLIEKNPKLISKNLKIPEKLQIKGMGIGVHKKNSVLIQKIEDKISEMKREGIIKKLEKKWNLNNEPS